METLEQQIEKVVVSMIAKHAPEIKEKSSFPTQQDWPSAVSPFEVGKPYFIRTVTYHLTGRLLAVFEHELLLDDAAWIAEDGRFAQAMETGEFSEIEPYPTGRRVIVGRGAIVDACVCPTLPRTQK